MLGKYKLCPCSTSLLLLPKLLGYDIPGKIECDLLSLPARSSGLGLFIPAVTATQQHKHSQHVNSPLVHLIVSQVHDAVPCFVTQLHLHSEAHTTQCTEVKDYANSVYYTLSPDLCSSVELVCGFECSCFDIRVFNLGAPSNRPFKSAMQSHNQPVKITNLSIFSQQ